jgi:hypothetical protein
MLYSHAYKVVYPYVTHHKTDVENDSIRAEMRIAYRSLSLTFEA